jgi:hypothetical protein
MRDAAALNAANSKSDRARARGRHRAQERLPAQLRQYLLDAINDRTLRPAIRNLGFTSNQV